MGRPRKNTRDECLDTFDSWDADQQGTALEIAEFIHRKAKRTGARKEAQKEEDGNWNVTPGAINPAMVGSGSTVRRAIADAMERNGNG